MKLLVTGGAGFIGSAFCRLTLAQGSDEIVNLDKLTYAANAASLAGLERGGRYRFVQADIADREAVRHVLSEHRPDAIVHLAAETHVDRSIDRPDAFIQTNIVGQYVLLSEAVEYWRALPSPAQQDFRFLHVSTDEVYGSLSDAGLFSEESPYAPTSPYSASKAAADHLALAWRHTYGLPVLVSNCSNNYGPFQFPEKLIALMTLNALEERPLPLYGDGKQVRDWLHVEDHVRALQTILARGEPGRSYNVGARNERTNLSVAELICDALDERSPADRPRRELIRFVQDRPGHDRRYAIDPTRVEIELGWRPQIAFDEGLEQTVQWYLDRPDWWRPLRERYDGGRLGLTGAVGG